jgi:hypothetical protein
MRYTDLIVHEATTENIDILKKLGKAIWKDLPEVFFGENKIFRISQLPSFEPIYQQYRDHKKFAPVFDRLKDHEIHVVNNPQYFDLFYGDNQEIFGYYSAKHKMLLIWLSNINRYFSDSNTTEHAVSTLIHELRHLFQFALYPQGTSRFKAIKKPDNEQDVKIDTTWKEILRHAFEIEFSANDKSQVADWVIQNLTNAHKLNSKQKKRYRNKTIKLLKNYAERDIEIDATWSQILGSVITVDYYGDDASKFADLVMQTLTTERKLNAKQLKHYRTKTIKFHQQFFSKKIENAWKEIVDDWESLATDFPIDKKNMDNWVYQVTGDLRDYIINNVHDTKLRQPLMDYYRQMSIREYKRITAPTRQSNRINKLISQLMPAWQNIVGQMQAEWNDPNTNSLKLMNKIIQQLDPYIDKTTNNNQQLSTTVRQWFVRWTKQKIIDSRD